MGIKCASISLRQALDFAWPAFRNHFAFFGAILLVFFGAWVALEIVVVVAQPLGIVFWAIAHLAFLVLFAGLEAGFLQIGLGLYDGREPAFSDLFAHLARGPKFLAGQLLHLLLLCAGICLLIVPGVYWGTRYALFGFGLAGKDANLLAAFRHSAALSAGVMPDLLALFAALLVLNVLGACLLGLGLFITIPLSVLVTAAVYRQLGAQ